MILATLAAALLAQGAPDYLDHQPTGSERLRCAVVGRDGRRARFDVDLDGAGAERRFRLRAEPGAAWFSGISAIRVEPNPREVGYDETEQLFFVADGRPYVLELSFEGSAGVQLAEAELYENSHGNPSLNLQLAAGICAGRASAEPIAQAAPLPTAPRVPRDGAHGAPQPMALTYRTRCTLVRQDLSETRFDMDVDALQRAEDKAGNGHGTLTLSRATNGPWPSGRMSFTARAYMALTVPETAGQTSVPGAAIMVDQDSGERRYSLIYLVDARPPYRGWLRVSDNDIRPSQPALIGSGVCEPIAGGRRGAGQ